MNYKVIRNHWENDWYSFVFNFGEISEKFGEKSKKFGENSLPFVTSHFTDGNYYNFEEYLLML